jgi:hypothetical protein
LAEIPLPQGEGAASRYFPLNPTGAPAPEQKSQPFVAGYPSFGPHAPLTMSA